jgi:4-amino-4-deoxy-L-arabinose transferase-like glycosyltransferase
MVDEILGLAALNTLLSASGAGLLVLVGWASVAELRHWVGLSYLAGVAWCGVLGELCLVCGLSFDRFEIVLVSVVPPALATVVSRFRLADQCRHVRAPGSRWLAIPAISIAGLAVVRSVAQPLSAWDAWSFWTPKAESIVYFHGLSSAFLRSGVANADYPAFGPVLESAAFRFMGQFDTTLVHIQFSLLFVAFVAAVGESLRRWAEPEKLGAVLIVIAAAPAMYTQSVNAMADVPLAIYVSLGALLLWIGIRERMPAALALAALFLAAAMATKTEGTVFATAVALSLLCVARRARLQILAVLIIAAAVSVLPWHLWLAANHVHGMYSFHPDYLVERASRFARAFANLSGNLVDPAQWLLLPVLVIVAVIVGVAGEHRSEAFFVVAVLAISILALDATYWGSSYPFAWYLRTSANRVVTTPLLVAATFTPLLISSTSRWTDHRRPETERRE